MNEESVQKIRDLFAKSKPPKDFQWYLPTGVLVKYSDSKEKLEKEMIKAFGGLSQ